MPSPLPFQRIVNRVRKLVLDGRRIRDTSRLGLLRFGRVKFETVEDAGPCTLLQLGCRPVDWREDRGFQQRWTDRMCFGAEWQCGGLLVRTVLLLQTTLHISCQFQHFRICLRDLNCSSITQC